jgi:hypothetical protein
VSWPCGYCFRGRRDRDCGCSAPSWTWNESTVDSRVVSSSVEAASGRDHSVGCPRDLGDEVNVVVVVQDDELLDTCDRSKDAVEDAHPSVLAAADPERVKRSGWQFGTSRSCDGEQMAQEVASDQGIVRRPSGVAGLSSTETREDHLSDRVVIEPDQYGPIDQPALASPPRVAHNVVVSEILACGREAHECGRAHMLTTIGSANRLAQRSAAFDLDHVGAQDQLRPVEGPVIDDRQPLRHSTLPASRGGVDTGGRACTSLIT